jgi:hypothetical protein
MLAGELVVVGDELPAMRDDHAAAAAQDLDGLADERERHRVAIGLEADEVIVGHAAGLAHLEPEAGLPAGRDEVAALVGESIDRPLMRRAMDADVGDLRFPRTELLAEVLVVDEAPARQEVALEVLHARFDLTLRLRPVRAADVRLEPPVVGELLERGVPDDAAVARRRAHRTRAVVEMVEGVAAEILEGPLVGVEELAQRLAHARLMEASSRVAEGEDEDVQRHGAGPEVDARLAPVDLALLPRRSLEPDRRALGRLLDRAQGTDEALDRLVAAPILPLAPQFLEQDLCRVLDLRGPLAQVLGVLRKQRVASLGPAVGLPRLLLQDRLHGLAIEIQAPSDLGLRLPLQVEPPMDLPPRFLTDHQSLPGWCDLRGSLGWSNRDTVQHSFVHEPALLVRRSGENSMTAGGDY